MSGTMKKIVFLYNKDAGCADIDPETICSVFRRYGFQAKVQAADFSANPFDGNEEIDIMAIGGGDGTVNYVLNCMKRKGLDITLGIIPIGTANDFAGVLGMSGNPLKAARQITEGKSERIDCGCVNGLYYINIFSFGIFTDTSQVTPDKLKRKIGKLAYIIYGMKELRYIHGIPLKITADGKAFDETVLLAMILNGKTAGRFRFTKTSKINNGLLDLVLLKRCNFLSAVFAMLYYQAGGKPRAIRHFQASVIEIDSALDEPTDVDGEPGVRFPLHIECIKGGVRMIMPQKGKRKRG